MVECFSLVGGIKQRTECEDDELQKADIPDEIK